jgi:hypothetical protein
VLPVFVLRQTGSTTSEHLIMAQGPGRDGGLALSNSNVHREEGGP